MTQAEKSARTRLAARYMERIRNDNKRFYAVKYWNFLVGFDHEPEPIGLGTMGAQAVRMTLDGIWFDTAMAAKG
jgi:hypothetical protein